MIRYRHAGFQDLPLLAAMHQAHAQETGQSAYINTTANEQRVREYLADGYEVLVFESNARIVAYTLLREDPEVVRLHELYVIPERRRAGIGRSIVDILRYDLLPSDKPMAIEIPVRDARARAFVRAVGGNYARIRMEFSPTKQAPQPHP